MTGPGFGALVLSLDFELHWGVRDHAPADGPYRRSLLGAREAVPAILDLFREFEVAGTWATVGFLFARSRAELEGGSPALRPSYAEAGLDPYAETVGEGEGDDPLHYAPSLVDAIAAAPRQELATHTWSHYYCLEPGQTREQFAADMRAAVAAARARGAELRSIVFPRNQHNPAYDEVLRETGVLCYRGAARGWMYRAAAGDRQTLPMRVARLADTHLSLTGPQSISWGDVPRPGGLFDVPASLFLRPAAPGRPRLEALRLRRLEGAIEAAARTRRIVHLWWHPHNFGADPAANLAVLRRLLQAFDRCRARWGMRSLSMWETARAAAGNAPPATSR